MIQRVDLFQSCFFRRLPLAPLESSGLSPVRLAQQVPPLLIAHSVEYHFGRSSRCRWRLGAEGFPLGLRAFDEYGHLARCPLAGQRKACVDVLQPPPHPATPYPTVCQGTLEEFSTIDVPICPGMTTLQCT